MDFYSMLALGVPLGLGLAAFGGAIGQGIVAQRALDSSARQPEIKGFALVMMVLGLAFIESLVIYSLVISFVMFGDKVKEQVMEAASSAPAVHEVKK